MVSSKRNRKTVYKELLCSRCDTKLGANQIYCYECGEPTVVLREDLSAFKTIKQVWEKSKQNRGANYGFVIFYFFALLIPLGVIVLYTHADYYIHNLLLLLLLPLLFIPFSMNISDVYKPLTIKGYLTELRSYPKYFLFILLNILYFFVLKVITSSVDPILNLVRLIMVLYWLSIVVPFPVLLAHKKVNSLKGLYLVYRGSRETRWQQFFIYVFCTLINIVGASLVGIGLLITIPFSIAIVKSYYLKMDNLELFAERSKESE